MSRDRETWPATAAEARELQHRLRARVVADDRLGPVRLVAGLDAHHRKDEDFSRGVAVLLSYPDLAVIEIAAAEQPLLFPYVSGLLSFREAPVLLAALSRLSTPPDLVLVDGQGLAHPRRFGLACHIGVATDLPTIGVAKSRLVGTFAPPGDRRGAYSPMILRGDTVGAALRTRAGVSPVYVSVGHRVSLDRAIDSVLTCSPRYRLSEPIRQADRHSRAWGQFLTDD